MGKLLNIVTGLHQKTKRDYLARMMNDRVVHFIHNQVNKIHEGGIILLVRNLFFILISPFLVLIVLFVRVLRPLKLIRFGELVGSRIGHFAGNTEVYLCERDLGIHNQRSLDIFYINSSTCNRQLRKMWCHVLCNSTFVTGLNLINRILPGGNEHRIPWRIDQDRDIYGTLELTKTHIAFTVKEEGVGETFLNKMGIANGSPFVCFLSRDSVYLDTVFPKGNWHYHDYRNSDIRNFIPAVEELTRRGYFALRMGSIVKQPLEISNPRIIDYSTKHRTEFLDIFLGAKCHFYLGDCCGFHAIPMIFRRPLAIVNMVPIYYAPTWFSKYLFIPKKLWLRKEKRFLTFREILSSQIGRFLYNQQYEQLGIEVVENTSDEIAALALEMDLRLSGKWQVNEDDEQLQKHFWALFAPSELNGVLWSHIGAEFLRQNKGLLG